MDTTHYLHKYKIIISKICFNKNDKYIFNLFHELYSLTSSFNMRPWKTIICELAYSYLSNIVFVSLKPLSNTGDAKHVPTGKGAAFSYFKC